jgi:hypothetical protein
MLYSHPPADFTRPYSFLGLEICTPTAELRWRLGFVYIISMFTFESSIVLSDITLYLYINIFSPLETIIRNAPK